MDEMLIIFQVVMLAAIVFLGIKTFISFSLKDLKLKRRHIRKIFKELEKERKVLRDYEDNITTYQKFLLEDTKNSLLSLKYAIDESRKDGCDLKAPLNELHTSIENWENYLDQMHQRLKSDNALNDNYRPEIIDLKDKLDQFISPMHLSLKNKKLKLVYDMEDNLSIWADPVKLHMSIRTMFRNFMTKAGDESEIMISAASKGDTTDLIFELRNANNQRFLDFNSNGSNLMTGAEQSNYLKSLIEQNKGTLVVEKFAGRTLRYITNFARYDQWSMQNAQSVS